jgi:hypothetical protein
VRRRHDTSQVDFVRQFDVDQLFGYFVVHRIAWFPPRRPFLGSYVWAIRETNAFRTLCEDPAVFFEDDEQMVRTPIRNDRGENQNMPNQHLLSFSSDDIPTDRQHKRMRKKRVERGVQVCHPATNDMIDSQPSIREKGEITRDKTHSNRKIKEISIFEAPLIWMTLSSHKEMAIRQG